METMTPSPREILEESSSFRPSLEKEKIVVETRIGPLEKSIYSLGELHVISVNFIPLIGKRVRVTIEEIE